MPRSENKNMFKLKPVHLIGMPLNTLASISPRLGGALAFNLFGMPRTRKHRVEESHFLATADLHFERIEGKRLALYHWGFRGPTVLLVHGWESHAGRWRKVAPALVQAGYQVLALDAPAHGRSDGWHFTMIKYAEVLRTLLSRFGPIHTVVGHSVGGAASIWAMGQVDDALRPEKAVILGSFSKLQSIMDQTRKVIGANDNLIASFNSYVVRRFGKPVSHFAIDTMATKLGEVEALIIHDIKDRVTRSSESEILHAAWPGSKLLLTEGYGHGLTAPSVTQSLLEFILEKEVAV